MTIKVLAIAPYPGLGDLLQEVARQDPSIELHVEIGDLQQALPVLDNANAQGYDVIVSRGGTASLIRERVGVPVIDVPVSGYDLLRVLTLVKDRNSRVAVVGFANICQGASTVSGLLDLKIPIYPIRSEDQVSTTLKQAFHQGAQIILGDVVTVRTAEEMGHHGILVTSGRESAAEALSEVKRVHHVYLQGKQKAHVLESILNSDQRGILYVDGAGKIRYANTSAAKLLVSDADRLQGQDVCRFLPELSAYLSRGDKQDNSSSPSFIKFRDTFFSVRAVSETGGAGLGTGMVFYLEEGTPLSEKKALLLEEPVRPLSFSHVIGSSRTIQSAIERARTLAQTDKNIWITGERGSGKSLIAQGIYKASLRSQKPFYRISCALLSSSNAQEMLFGAAADPGLLNRVDGGTLYLEDVHEMPLDAQEKLCAYLREGLDIRILSSSTLSLADALENEKCYQDLVHCLGEFCIVVPPLRERIEDIEDIACVWIASHNSKYGKQIVGFRDEVLDLLKNHQWPGNIKELKNVIDEMLLLTNGDYVEKRQADSVWERYETEGHHQAAAGQYVLDVTGSLEEIEQRILLHVLEEEGMHQSRAAKRLGINRSTLWRKLRDVLQNKTIN